MAFTPGPWTTSKLAGGDIGIVADSEQAWDLAIVRDGGTRETAFNADLIAAAPDLLAACEEALNFFTDTRTGRDWRDGGGTEADTLREAIAKAIGGAR